jgi:hypothetical protein
VDDWAAFDRYSSRVHEITRLFSSLPLRTAGSSDIDPFIFLTLHSYRPETPIFPSLRIFNTPRHLPEHINRQLVMMPFMTTTLRRITLFAPHSSCSSSDYLEQLVVFSLKSQLTHLRIFGRSALPSWHSIVKIQNLEFLDMNFHAPYDPFGTYPYYTMFLEQLSKLKNLSSLLLSVPTFISARSPSEYKFRRLERLALTGSTRAFTNMCRMTPHIEYLVLDSAYVESGDNWKDFLATLPKSCPSLKHILIYGKFDVADTLSVVGLVEPLFRLALKGLCLRLQFPVNICLSDADMVAIAAAWPSLINLEIFAEGRYMMPYMPTMEGVKSVLDGCRNLTYLRMSSWNKVVDMSTNGRQVSLITLENTYPPFVNFI